jgi:hypothetical protein
MGKNKVIALPARFFSMRYIRLMKHATCAANSLDFLQVEINVYQNVVMGLLL